MQDKQDKALTALIRSMKRALAREHNIEVPHAALRACFLQAQGENPHAFAAKEGRIGAPLRKVGGMPREDELRLLVVEAPHYFHPGYDFDGKKLEWLKRAGLVPSGTPRDEDLSAVDVRTLYLALDDIGCTGRLALDPEGEFLLPEDWQFSKAARLLQLHAELPKVKRYGLPDYLANPAEFFSTRFALQLSHDYRSSYEDLGDDSGDSGWVNVRIDDVEWRKLLNAVLAEGSDAVDGVAEWVGQHYGRVLESESKAKQAEWLERYLESLERAKELDSQQDVTFEYVLPDEDGDSVPASVNLDTGLVTLSQEVPEHVRSQEVRTRIWSEPNGEGTDYEVYFRQGWRLRTGELKALRLEVGYQPKA